ncbi:MAG: hypothetical protein JST80_11465 [Bdellovibrionales bacterium]|nr:hypothetical protein [Bdellovibrionales bacterium]
MKRNQFLTLSSLVTKLTAHILKLEPSAIQLDGSTKSKPSRKVWAYFEYEGRVFKLHSDTKIEAVKRLIYEAKKTGNPFDALLLTHTKQGRPCLRINDGTFESKGWYCYYVKEMSSFKKAA